MEPSQEYSREGSLAPLAQQQAHVRVLHSVERAGLTPVFGTTVPPSGLSGLLREQAFRYSEGDLRHWMTLLFADRVNMVEGVLDDLRHGHVPNPFAEMGLAMEWRHNRAAFVRKVVIGAAVVGTAWWLLRRRRR